MIFCKDSIYRMYKSWAGIEYFFFGWRVGQRSINPDDVTGWQTKSEAQMGGQTNNTALMRSYAIGLRGSF
jgi:hypothetical protein